VKEEVSTEPRKALQDLLALRAKALKRLLGAFPVNLAAPAEAVALQVAASLVAAEAGPARAAAKIGTVKLERGSFDPLFFISSWVR
jgi:hypothetical protein